MPLAQSGERVDVTPSSPPGRRSTARRSIRRAPGQRWPLMRFAAGFFAFVG